MPFINRKPLNYPVNSESSIRIFQYTRAPTLSDFKMFIVGDEWWDTSSLDFWKLVYKDNTQGIWRKMSGTSAAIETITGDAGGATGPDALNNFNLVGAGGLTTTGNPATFTMTIAPSGGGNLVELITPDSGGAVTADAAGNINFLGDSGAYLNGMHFLGDPANNTVSARDLRNITVYVVDPTALETEYQTVQAAIDVAQADGGGTVYVRPGIYTEDLVLYDAVDITAAVATPAGYQTTIIGVHTPPAAGAMSFRNLALSDTTDILNSNAAGTATIVIIDCITDVANGYTFNLPNWTGLIAFLNSHCLGTEDGFIDIGAGAGDLLVLNSTIGVGATNIAAVGGNSRIVGTNIQCQLDSVGSAVTNIRACQWINLILNSDDATTLIVDSIFISDQGVAINQTSTLPVNLEHVTLDTTAAPDVITGTSTVIFGSVLFVQAQGINAGITQNAAEYQRTGPIEIIPSDESVAAEDAWIKFNIPSGGGFSHGIDNSDTDALKITDGVDPSNGNLMWKMTATGQRTMLLQTSFLATLTPVVANVTGNGTVYTVIFDSIANQQGTSYANGTGIFTAPITGWYTFSAYVAVGVTLAAATLGQVVLLTTARPYHLNKGNWAAAAASDDIIVVGGTAFVYMTAADTARVQIMGLGQGADTIDIVAGQLTYFSGALIH